ncbi:unnamed protein product [Tetraodon nigroviridis]|uniref:(spotted green pufferfish) hypothetical protein n=1 Tax=Tetraodon nigroviridis TaxID=99883 RepID=Q4SEK9_TETNG|nr:unnamed protein product [Tetraodon nigroviridis]
MNSVTTGTLHPHLREEEVLVVENAIRLAIDSIINVLYGVNSARNHEYQRMVGDRDKEIQRLECRLRELERGQQPPRQPLSACGLVLNPDCSRFLVAQVSADPQPAPQHRYDPSSSDPELAKRDCERSDAVAHFERPSLRISFQSDESSLPLSPSRRALRQNGTCRSSESSRTPDAAENAPTSPSSSLVKEEPCDIDKVFIQWEIEVQEYRDARSIRTEAHTPPDGCAFPYRQNLRMKRKKSVPMFGAVRGGPEAEEGSLEGRLQTILRPESSSPTGQLGTRGPAFPGSQWRAEELPKEEVSGFREPEILLCR